jgi:uncharacterized membrane protein YfcA
MDARSLLLLALGLVAVAFVAFWGRALVAESRRVRPTGWELVVGVITDFFDTLGIGSYATTTTLYRARDTVEPGEIPGTLNVGHAVPTFAQALIYTELVEVEPTTLIGMIGAAVAGAWLGASVVTRLDKVQVLRGMGVALLVAAALTAGRAADVLPGGGVATGLAGGTLALGLAGNFVLGALMTLGIGLYGPCMILVGLLGMDPKAAFPIMMGSCAFLMPLANVRFIQAGRYAPGAALGLTLGGLPAVLVAAWIVQSLPLDVVRWLVVAVVTWTAASMLRQAQAAPA